MGQLGVFDADKRLAALSAKGDPLEAIDRLVPWESFREDIEAVVQTREAERKSAAGRKPIDAIVLFRMLICSRWTISRTSRLSIRCAIACHLRGFSAADRGLHPRRHDVVAVPREAGPGWRH